MAGHPDSSACGHAEPSGISGVSVLGLVASEGRGISVSSRRGWGPGANEKVGRQPKIGQPAIIELCRLSSVWGRAAYGDDWAFSRGRFRARSARRRLAAGVHLHRACVPIRTIRAAFTQGLQWVDGFLYEGTGNHGASSIRKVQLETGEVLQKRDLPEQYFGEGIVVRKDELVQLTYKTEIGFVYDRADLRAEAHVQVPGRGMGADRRRHASRHERRQRPAAAARSGHAEGSRRLPVTAAGTPVKNLNELEWVKGEIFANIWMTDYVARIDPATGRVTGWIDLRGLLPARDRANADVLNGIAYDAAGDRLFVTGKWWPRLFEIKLMRAASRRQRPRPCRAEEPSIRGEASS